MFVKAADGQDLVRPLKEILGDMTEAHHAYDAAILQEEAARTATAEFEKRLNALQAEFDKRVEEIRAKAPRATEWGKGKSEAA